MKRKILALTCLVLVVVTGVTILVRHNTEEPAGTALAVSASFYPLADFTRNIGKDHVNVRNITPAGAEPHDYEPAPRDLASIDKSALFIYNGGNFEPWADKFLQSYKHVAVKASSNMQLHDVENEEENHGTEEHESEHTENHHTTDPHFWLDPVLAQQAVKNIRDGLIKADPAHADDYRQNADDYIQQLVRLDNAYSTGLQHCQIDTVIASHEAFGYLAERYNFTALSISGISPEEEPSAQKMADLAALAKEKNISYIFFESLVSPRLADTIAQEAGAKTLVFDPIEGLTNEDQQNGKNYISIQYDNLQAIRTARACQ